MHYIGDPSHREDPAEHRDRRVIAGEEQMLASVDIIENAGKGPNISFLCVVVRLEKELGGSVVDSANLRGQFLARCSELLRKPKITNFNIALIADKNILWLQILHRT